MNNGQKRLREEREMVCVIENPALSFRIALGITYIIMLAPGCMAKEPAAAGTSANTSHLQGRVEENRGQGRINREEMEKRKQKLLTTLSGNSFQINVNSSTVNSPLNSGVGINSIQAAPPKDGSALKSSTPRSDSLSSAAPISIQTHSTNLELDGNSEVPNMPPNVKPPAPDSKQGGAPSVSSAPSSRKPSVQSGSVIIRLTYHMLDEKNAFKALKLAKILQAKGTAPVTLVLEKEGARIANRSINLSYIHNGESVARSLNQTVREFIVSGGRVIVPMDSAKEYGLLQSNVVQGVELMPEEDYADEILCAGKLMDY